MTTSRRQAGRVLVTGHRRYIGAVLVPMLVAEGYEVVGVDTDLYRDCELGGAPDPSPTREADVRVVLFGEEVAPPLGAPVVEVCAVAKRALRAGEVLDEYGICVTYGEAVNTEEMCAGRYLPRGPGRGLHARARRRPGRGAPLRRRGAAPRPARGPAAGRAVPALPRGERLGGRSAAPTAGTVVRRR
jgi:hypothetical protein